MTFCSGQFVLFFLVVFVLYYSLPKKYQWILLLVSSYYFYMCWKPEFIVLIVITTLIHYFASIEIEKATSQKVKKVFLVFSICSSLCILFFFKYFNFFGDNINHIFYGLSIPVNIPTLNIILPIGISFYTFQTMSYTIEVYRGNVAAEKHFGYFSLFVTYFPQLVAGPIERPQDLLPQIRKEHEFDYANVAYGARLMLLGFFKKLVVADSLGIFVDYVFNNISAQTHGYAVFFTSFLFVLQVYCDFSGYSEIARGCAKVMGVDLMVNFKSPCFFSHSIKEFWRRWHISLSSWFRDYLYIPLGGNRKGKIRKGVNLFIVFLMSGLWHGASWNFVIWGGLQSFYINIGDFVRRIIKRPNIINIPKMKKIQGFLEIIVTFTLSSFSFIFFRTSTFSEAFCAIRCLFRDVFDITGFAKEFLEVFRNNLVGINKIEWVFIFGSLLALFLYDYYSEKMDLVDKMNNIKPWGRVVVYVCILLAMAVLVPYNAKTGFMYFQF